MKGTMRNLDPAFLLLGAIGLFAMSAPACGSKSSNPAVSSGDGNGPGGGASSSSSGGSLGGSGSPGTFTGSSGGGGADGGSTTTTSGVAPQTIDNCTPSANLTSAQVKLLQGGGSAGSLRFLYPYDATLFPRGLLAPSIMWDPGPADLVYVHIQSALFEYKGCLAPTASGQLDLPASVWSAAEAHTKGGNDPFAVDLTLLKGTTVTGPIHETIFIAPATLKGTIYYNSYSSKLVGAAAQMSVPGFGIGSGAVLRINPGKSAEVFLGNQGCTGCHAVSANGTRMVADVIVGAGGETYALKANAPPEPAPLVTGAQGPTFVGMSPDGSLYVANAHPGGMGPRYAAIAGGLANATLFETDTGKQVDNSGIPTGAMCPTFSPEGTTLVFNDYAINSGHGLATMTFDKTMRTATNYKKVFEETDTSVFPGWPFFLPDEKAVVYLLGSANDFSGGGVGLSGTSTSTVGAPTGDLYMLDLASGKDVLLARAMGFASAQDAASGKTYLPFGTDDVHHVYYPTVSPVAAGGYFWAFFDSFRHYGNQGLQRQLWGTAIDVSPSGTYTTDTSHPAFYITGQELGTGNHRAFTALDPCQSDGASCTTGVDCCSGLCTNGKCGGPPRCSNIDEACGPGHSCCDPTVSCIAGYCAAAAPK
jgi:hypothetical protein